MNFPELSNFINIYFNQLPTFEIDRIKINIKLNQQNKNNISSTLSQEFYINTIPFTNTSSEHALPIDVQGFRETYPIIHPNIQGKFQLSAIKKAYYKEHGKTIDLLPKHLTADNLPSYELIQQFTGEGYSELRFHFYENLIQPRTVFIDADWFQLDHFRISDLKLSFYNRSEDYFKIKPVSSQPTILSNERLKVTELIELANIKNHRIIKYDDLKLIISSLVPKHSIFHKAIQHIENISVINNNNFYNYSIETFSLIPEQKVVLQILLSHIQCLLQQLLPVGSQIKLSLKSN